MAQKKKKNLLVFRFPEPETQEEHDGIVYLFDSFTGKQDFHVLILFEDKRENLEIQEFGTVTANGASLRKVQEEIQGKLRSISAFEVMEETIRFVSTMVEAHRIKNQNVKFENAGTVVKPIMKTNPDELSDEQD